MGCVHRKIRRMKVVNNITLTSGRFDNSIALQQQRSEDSLAVPRPPKNPPLRYPGAKTKVVKTLLAEMPMDWTEFREPFAGGLSLTLCVMQKYPARRAGAPAATPVGP